MEEKSEKEIILEKVLTKCNKERRNDDGFPICEKKETCPLWVEIDEDTYYSFCSMFWIRRLLLLFKVIKEGMV